MVKTYVVTGGAGFMGSNIAATLTERYPEARIIVCDVWGEGDKWQNLAKHPVDELVPPSELFYWLEVYGDSVEAIIHMGAISSTTVLDADIALEMNFALSKILRAWCVEKEKRFIYASSAATYGDGAQGFNDDDSLSYLQSLKPLNTYAWTKCQFDYYVARTLERGEPQPKQQVGLKFFNVYGPNEYHKGDQASVLSRVFPHAKANRPVQLFKSYNEKYEDGAQLRDFVYVKDCVSVVLWLLENPEVSGLYNVGTGKARSFADMAHALFAAVGNDPQIQYIDMPHEMRPKYQYFTEAKMDKLRAAGFTQPFQTLEEGVKDYVQNYLMKEDPYL